jgi:hypothetical protein
MRRLVTQICALAALSGLLLGGCGGSEEPADERQEAATNQRTENVSLAVRPIVLAQEVSPGPVFSCTSDPQVEETVRGPSAKTNLADARLVRSRHGICAVLTLPKNPSTPSRTLRITFYRHGDTSAPPESLTSGEPKRSVDITIYSDYSTQARGVYLLSTSIPENGSSPSGVKAGRFGARGRVFSILVSDPRMPDWVFEESTVWRAQIV